MTKLNILEVSETISNGLGDTKLGQRVSAIINFKVIEKTKSYKVLKITGFYLTDNKRSF